jgi:hypothetical protein
MIHLCRDFLTLSGSTAPGTNVYLLSIFLQNVLDFTPMSMVSFPFTSASYLLAAGAFDSGLSASINKGAGSEYKVQIPTSSYLLSSQDVNRILTLKSKVHPKANSGLFRITAVDLALNQATIDYRSSQFPPSEDGLRWRIFEAENAVSVTGSWRSGSNGYQGKYNSNLTNSSTSRIVLRSPEAFSFWQVRLCMESNIDTSLGACPIGMTISPGLNVRSDSPDFDVQGLHGPMIFNSLSASYRGSAVGITPSVIGNQWARGQWRINIIGDDETGTTTMLTRISSFLGAGHSWASFGIPMDEDPILKRRLDPNDQIQRLFVVGLSVPSASAINWRSAGYHVDSDVMGVAWSDYNQPIPCVVSSYADNSNQTTHVRNASNSADSPFLKATELLDVDLVAGTMFATDNLSSSIVYAHQPKRLGTLPFLKQGRSNFGNWTISGDVSSSWLHTENGVYLQWGGPPPTGLSVGSMVYELSSTFATDNAGTMMVSINDPSFDPFVAPFTAETVDKDAARYRKTYSYFRQEQRNMSVVKMGSNPSKS